MPAKIAPRVALGETLIELGKEKSDLVVLDADIVPSAKIEQFKTLFPTQFIEMGISEQNMIGFAAGLSTVGFIPFAITFCVFASRRACDQVTVSVAYPQLNVTIVGNYPGLFVGMNGATHQSMEDIAIMRSIPKMSVVEPLDAVETREAVKFAYQYNGPLYLRIGRDPITTYLPQDYQFKLGQAYALREGKDLTIISAGYLMEEVMEVARNLSQEGIETRVINMSSLKPIDKEVIVRAAKETNRIVTVENHNILGGLGSAVAEVVTEYHPVRIKRIGVNDVFGKSGSNDEMKEKFKLTTKDILADIKNFIKTS
jgi:transketolase